MQKKNNFLLIVQVVQELEEALCSLSLTLSFFFFNVKLLWKSGSCRTCFYQASLSYLGGKSRHFIGFLDHDVTDLISW